MTTTDLEQYCLTLEEGSFPLDPTVTRLIQRCFGLGITHIYMPKPGVSFPKGWIIAEVLTFSLQGLTAIQLYSPCQNPVVLVFASSNILESGTCSTPIGMVT